MTASIRTCESAFIFFVILLVSCSLTAWAEKEELETLLQGHSLRTECVEGRAAFANSMHRYLEASKCRFCHSGGGPGPGYISPDIDVSYFSVRNYINFESRDLSKLLLRGGAPHATCPSTICNAQTAEALGTQISAWWDGGEKDCQTMGTLFSQSLQLPSDLAVVTPETRDQYRVFEIDLSTIDRKLRHLKIEFELQHLALPSETNPGALRIRNPRLKGRSLHVKVQNLRFLVNRSWDIANNTFLGGERVYRPNTIDLTSEVDSLYPRFSITPAIVIYENAEEAAPLNLSVSFDQLEPVEDIGSCAAQEAFDEFVFPLIAARNCLGCHAHSTSNQPVRKRAREKLLFSSLDDPKLCPLLKQVAYPDRANGSVLVSLLSQEKLGHPSIFVNVSESIQILQEWIDREFPWNK